VLQKFNIVFEKEFEKIIMKKYDNNLMYYQLKPHTFIEMKDVKEVLEEVEKLGSEIKYLNLFEFGENCDTDSETRMWASDSKGNKQTIADAFVIRSLAQKIVINFYLKFHKPHKPTRVFNKTNEAIKWLLSIEKSE